MKTVKFYFLGVMLLAFFNPVIGQIENFRENQKKAFSANSTEECQSSLKFCNEVLKVVPNHPLANYLSARLNALLGNEDVALKHLKEATKLGYTTKLPFNNIHQLNDSAFITLREKEGFNHIIGALENSEKPIHKSQIAFTISDKELVPEGITYDPIEKMFYLGSETKHKIVKVDQKGNSVDFTTDGQDGLSMVLGIHIDPVRRILWACSYKETGTGVFKYDLPSGTLIKKYILPPNGIRREFNDLVIHPNGDVYITAPGNKAIYMISQGSDSLELFLRSELFISPNGITLSKDGSTIYFSDVKIGIYSLDIKTKSFKLLTIEPSFSTIGIDGLYFVNNKLYAVQIVLNQICMFSLNKDASHIESCEILERNGPYLDKPTTGVIVDNYFYFIADTQGKGDKLGEVIIMKASIK
ncbi:SMP-30/gluconolactonase/LRE family protein [Lentimicrobium sp. S6]|uniref:SMP-30/gluconolactonase/LRE family protein n=1 Tax=Lentimicrobium sp. S6 TaxID=2735872 RepID=UPI001552DF79|nr:SMP-30/gluconolactonase/LRE family protein [Lentimicrobium sp. S6]NPD47286.1 SMP-30/gluconolactonase/LRE family protein [Lentimicrobium sp. S6]